MSTRDASRDPDTESHTDCPAEALRIEVACRLWVGEEVVVEIDCRVRKRRGVSDRDCRVCLGAPFSPWHSTPAPKIKMKAVPRNSASKSLLRALKRVQMLGLPSYRAQRGLCCEVGRESLTGTAGAPAGSVLDERRCAALVGDMLAMRKRCG